MGRRAKRTTINKEHRLSSAFLSGTCSNHLRCSMGRVCRTSPDKALHDATEPPIPEESSVFLEALLAEEELLEAEMANPGGEDENESVCSDYPDSELVEETESKTKVQNHENVFLDYMLDMFEAAFSGDVLEFFESGNMQGLELALPADTTVDKLPKAASLKPCSRPSFRKLLRPREIPPEAEEFPMDCLPSESVCFSAPPGPTLERCAAQMQCAALAEEILKDISTKCIEQLQIDAPLDDSFVLEERVAVPVPPSTPKPEGRNASRPRQCQKAAEEVSLRFVPEPVVAPTPPEGPPSTGRPQRATIDKLACQSMHITLKGGASRYMPFPPDISPHSLKTTSPRILFDSNQRANDASMSAMAMDLDLAGDSACKTAAASLSKPFQHTITSTGHAKIPYDLVEAQRTTHTSFVKSSSALPPIAQPTWGGVSTPRGTWRSHDIA